MYECEYKDWINEYGYNEGYLYKDLSSYMTGHSCIGSAFETDSDCGNCSSAYCESCRENYIVSIYSEPVNEVDEFGYIIQNQHRIFHKYFNSLDEAKKFYNNIE